MATKIGGVTLSPAQFARLQTVCADPQLVAARKAITLYKANDSSLALFRTQAGNMLVEITARGVANRPLTKPQAQYVNRWLVDGNDMFRLYFIQLNRALGFSFVQGV